MMGYLVCFKPPAIQFLITDQSAWYFSAKNIIIMYANYSMQSWRLPVATLLQVLSLNKKNAVEIELWSESFFRRMQLDQYQVQRPK